MKINLLFYIFLFLLTTSCAEKYQHRIASKRVWSNEDIKYLTSRKKVGPWIKQVESEIPPFGTLEARIKAHQALFDIYLPWNQIGKERLLLEQARRTREEIWAEIGEDGHIQAILTLFSNLNLLESDLLGALFYNYLPENERNFKKFSEDELTPYRYYIETAKQREILPGLWALQNTEKQRILKLMILGNNPILRRLALKIERLYLNKIYAGPFGELLDLRKKGLMPGMLARQDFKDPELLKKQPVPPVKFAYDEESMSLKTQFDYVIVGGGVSGSVIASHLQSKGKKVLILEKGPLYFPNYFKEEDKKKLLERVVPPEGTNSQLNVSLPQVLGGGSVVGDDIVDSWEEIYKEKDIWPFYGDPPRTFEEEDLNRAVEWFQYKFFPRPFDTDDKSKAENVIMNSADDLGLKKKEHLWMRYKPGFGRFEENDKQTVVETLLKEPLQSSSNPLFVLTGAEVTRLYTQITGDTRFARALEFILKRPEERQEREKTDERVIPYNKPLKIFAKRFILTAGPIGNSSILIRSGFKHPLLGKGLCSWPEVLVSGVWSQVLRKDLPSAMALLGQREEIVEDLEYVLDKRNLGRMDTVDSSFGDSYQYFMRAFEWEKVSGVAVMAYDPGTSLNRIYFDKFGKLSVFYLLGEDSKRRLGQGIHKALLTMKKAGLKKIAPNTSIPLFGTKGTEYNYFEEIANAEDPEWAKKLRPDGQLFPISTRVLCGGTPIDKDYDKGVVGPDWRPWGITNVFVGGSSLYRFEKNPYPMVNLMILSKLMAFDLE